jgi:hypothetical protein
MATDGWYPPALYNPAASSAPSQVGAVDKGVLHKTISAPGSFRARSDSYFGHQSYPHFTTDVQSGVFKVWQHISIRQASKALKNTAGGVQTNTNGVIQVEIVGWADTSAMLHSDPALHRVHQAGLAALMRWIEAETDVPRSSTVEGYHQYPPENGIRLGNEPWRMTFAEWEAYRGWCGHQHVPENVHGDPGAFDINTLLGQSAPAPAPTTKEIEMFMVDDPGAAPDGNRQWMCDASTKRHIKTGDEVNGNKLAGVVHLTEKPETVVMRRALLAGRRDVTV